MAKREDTVAEREWHEFKAELVGRPRESVDSFDIERSIQDHLNAMGREVIGVGDEADRLRRSGDRDRAQRLPTDWARPRRGSHRPAPRNRSAGLHAAGSACRDARDGCDEAQGGGGPPRGDRHGGRTQVDHQARTAGDGGAVRAAPCVRFQRPSASSTERSSAISRRQGRPSLARSADKAGAARHQERVG